MTHFPHNEANAHLYNDEDNSPTPKNQISGVSGLLQGFVWGGDDALANTIFS